MKKNFFSLRINIIIVLIIFLKEINCSLEEIKEIKYYLNQICSYNGKPKITYNEKNETVIKCECEIKYTNEPREDKKRYVYNQLIQCSYRKKKRFTTFFLAGITPFGIDYIYLGHYLYFVIILVCNGSIITFNCISMVLNYQLEKKNEEAKRQLKLKKSSNKFNLRNLAEINDKCVKNFNLAAKILIIFMVIFWIGNAIFHAFGKVNDSNGVPTENDMLY